VAQKAPGLFDVSVFMEIELLIADSDPVTAS
jgi:hypothetical protein